MNHKFTNLYMVYEVQLINNGNYTRHYYRKFDVALFCRLSSFDNLWRGERFKIILNIVTFV